jgi:hypothetical protein
MFQQGLELKASRLLRSNSVIVVVLVVGPISTAAMRAYCTLTPQWRSVIHLQRRCTPSGVRNLC